MPTTDNIHRYLDEAFADIPRTPETADLKEEIRGNLQARVASAEAIDTAMKLGCGHPMGPLALADAIGLDVVYAMAKTMHRELNDRRYSPPALLRRLVLNRHLGKKTQRGLYDYSVEPARENPELWPAHAEPLSPLEA